MSIFKPNSPSTSNYQPCEEAIDILGFPETLDIKSMANKCATGVDRKLNALSVLEDHPELIDIELQKFLSQTVSEMVSTSNSVQKSGPSSKRHKRKEQDGRSTMGRIALEDRVKIVEYYFAYDQNAAGVLRKWPKFSMADQPSINSIRDVVKKFRRTGSVRDCLLGRSGRKRSAITPQNVERMRQAYRDDPTKSIRRYGKELGLSSSSAHQICRSLGIIGQPVVRKKDFQDKEKTGQKKKESFEKTPQKAVNTQNAFPLGLGLQPPDSWLLQTL